MFKTIAIVAVVLIVAILIFAATKPDTFRIQRTASIKAPPEKIFALINDLHSWGSWSPWEKMDPAMKRTHSGAVQGKGAVYEWDGNQKVGQGRMEITETSPPSKVVILFIHHACGRQGRAIDDATEQFVEDTRIGASA